MVISQQARSIMPWVRAAYRTNADAQVKLTIEEKLAAAPLNTPILFDTLTADVFLSFIVSLRKKDGSKLGASSCNTHRAALFNLFRNYHKVMGTELEKELASYFKGLKRTIAENTARGEDEIRIGKDPLEFSLYRYWCKEMIVRKEKDFIFARCFLVICWNLMCRSSNAFNIRLPHMEWKGDALR
jgi:hypothetical protein